MNGPGHIALSAGLTSVGSTLWVRSKVRQHIEEAEETLPVKQRVYNRGPYLLAAGIVTGSAAVVSGKVDQVERDIFGHGAHRTVLHSLPNLVAGKAIADLSQEEIRDSVRSGLKNEDRFDFSDEYVDRTVDATNDLVKTVSDGATLGIFTHILGDVPTKGAGGVASLQSLHPVSTVGVNVGKHSSKALTTPAIKIGLWLTALSWVANAVYVSSPDMPGNVIKSGLKNAREMSADEAATVAEQHFSGVTQRIVNTVQNPPDEPMWNPADETNSKKGIRIPVESDDED